MSGYALAVVDTGKVSKITALLRPEETMTRPMDHGRTLVYVSSSGTIEGDVLFQGYAIDHERERMTFVGAGAATPDPTRPLEGSYFTARVSGDGVRCGTDVYGFVPLAWTASTTLTAVSDSYLLLIAMRRAVGLPCTPDDETIRGRMWLNSMSLQQLGRETYCREVRYATPGTEVRITVDDGSLTELPLDLVAFYGGGFDSHADAVTQSATRMVRVFKTYAEAGALVSFALSGGTDSRLVLAAALAADISDALHIASTNNGTADYPIALGLSERFAFPLNPSSAASHGTLVSNDLLAGWAGTSLGLYDALYMPRAFRVREVPSFSVAGHGAEISKGNFGWRPLSSIGMPAEGMAQSRRALEAIGADPDHRWGSEWHYIAFRNSIHSGRAILSSDYVAGPAAQIPLIGLSRSTLNDLPAPRKGARSIVLDALIKLSPELAAIPFDDPVKDAPPEYIEGRLARVGGTLDTNSLQPYEVAGTARPSNRILGSQTDIAVAAGFTGALTPKNLMPLTEAPLHEFADLVSDEVRQHLDRVEVASNQRFSAASREAGAVGKLLALTTVM